MRCSPNPDDNLRGPMRMLRQAAAGGVQIACLPELFRTQYFCQVEDAARFDLAEPIPGPTSEVLRQVASETKMAVVGSIFERRAAGVYHNTAVVIDADGAVRGRYRKMHIPDDPLYYEKYYFTPGDLGFQAFDTSFAAVGTLICWDQWYPEAARLTALRGADIIFYPTAIGWHPAEKAEFGADQSAPGKPSSAATRSPTASTSRRSTGLATKDLPAAAWSSGAVRSWPTRSGGSSRGPASTPSKSSSPTCDPRLQEETRRNWPFLRDRRIDAYAPITQRLLD